MQTQHRISYCHMEMEGLFFIGKPLPVLGKYSVVQGRVGLPSLQRKQQEWWWWQRDRASSSACMQSLVFCNSLGIAHWFSTDLPNHPHLDGLTARLEASWLCDAGSCNTYPSRCELPDTLGTVCKQPRCKISSQAIFFLSFFLKVQYNIHFTILTAESVWLNGIKQW